jgi:HEAT repeat protein
MSASDKEQVHLLTVRRQLVAARSLAKMRDGSGSTVALDNLKSPVPGVRALAALALGDMLTSWQAPGLDPELDDPDEGVRRAAAAAVIKIYARAAQAS